MPYDEKLADRVREALVDMPHVEEKKMFKGLAFMVDGKLCLCVNENELLCRFDPALQEELAEKPGYRTFIMQGKECKGYCYVDKGFVQSKKDFDYWVQLCIAFNAAAKASKKTGKKKG